VDELKLVWWRNLNVKVDFFFKGESFCFIKDFLNLFYILLIGFFFLIKLFTNHFFTYFFKVLSFIKQWILGDFFVLMAKMQSLKFEVENFSGKNNFELWKLKMHDLLVQQGVVKVLL
jgi:hypothetical protein